MSRLAPNRRIARSHVVPPQSMPWHILGHTVGAASNRPRETPSDPVSSGKTCQASTGELSHTAHSKRRPSTRGNRKFQCVDLSGTAPDVVQVQTPTCAPTPTWVCAWTRLHHKLFLHTHTHTSKDISKFFLHSWQDLL